MKILHTSDLHLKTINDSRWKALTSLIELGNNEKIDLMVICGDLFNKTLKVEELRIPLRELFETGKYPICLLRGNHDFEGFQAGYDFGNNVNVIENIAHPYDELLDVRIWGLPYEEIERDEILYRLHSIQDKLDNQKVNILLYHGDFLHSSVDVSNYEEEDGTSGSSWRLYMPIKPKYVADLNFQYIFCGHYHMNYISFAIKGPQQEIKVVYSGSPTPISEKEIGIRKINLFDLNRGPMEYSLKTVPFIEKIIIKLDPFTEISALAQVESKLVGISPQAQIILTVNGYLNQEKSHLSEVELRKSIAQSLSKKSISLYKDLQYSVRDITEITEDPLFLRAREIIDCKSSESSEKSALYDILIDTFIQNAS